MRDWYNMIQKENPALQGQGSLHVKPFNFDQPLILEACPYLWSDWYIVPSGLTVIRQVQQMLTLNTIASRLRKYLGSHLYCIMYSTTLLIIQPLKLVRLQRSVSQLLPPTSRTFRSLLPGRSYVVEAHHPNTPFNPTLSTTVHNMP